MSAANHRSSDRALVRRFREDPEGAYAELLDRFTPALLRMIRRFMRDSDDAMEVYTAVCERLRAHDFRALAGFDQTSEILPWLSVVAANACRDRLRKLRPTSVPMSVLSRLTEFERLVFTYYYGHRHPHEDVVGIIGSKDGKPCTAMDVMCAVEKIDELLSTSKRWQLLVALNANRPVLSIDALEEAGVSVAVAEPGDDTEAAFRNKDRIQRLNAALSEMESEDRLLVLLRYEHGMKAPEIADVMDYDNHKYVYTRLRTLIARLRRTLSEE